MTKTTSLSIGIGAKSIRAFEIAATIFLLSGCGGADGTGGSGTSGSGGGGVEATPGSASIQPSSISLSTGDASASTAPSASKLVAPTLSGIPSTAATVGQTYSFQPSSTNPAGGILSFSIQNKPKWAVFNTSTGQLSGTPATVDSGTDPDIVISANNAAATTDLPPFAIQVAQTVNNSITIAWTAPAWDTDGSPASALAGYRIHYGVSPTELNNQVEISDPNVLTYELENVASGTWYFAVSALNSDGSESNLSTIGSRTI